VLGVVAVSSLCALATPLPAAVAVLPRWSDTLVRLHCSVQALSGVVGVLLFCVVAPEPRSSCRRLLCRVTSAAGPGTRDRRASDSRDRAVVARLFHVEAAGGKAAGGAASTPVIVADAEECLLPQSSAAAAVDADVVAGRRLSDQEVERRLAYEHSNAVPRTRLLATSDNLPLPDDVVFAHTSV